MTIGEALKKIRNELGLTQKQMAQDFINRPYYARVENNRSNISADILMQILFSHEIDIKYFMNLIQDDYVSSQILKNIKLGCEIDQAANKKNIKNAKKIHTDILKLSNSVILKVRSTVMLAYLNDSIDKLDPQIPKIIIFEFNKYEKWITNLKLLKLLESTMIIWEQPRLDIFVKQLITNVKHKRKISDNLLNTYLKIFSNYLFIIANITSSRKQSIPYVVEIIEYLHNLDDSPNNFLYKTLGEYYKAYFKNEKDKKIKIENFVKNCGYKIDILYWMYYI